MAEENNVEYERVDRRGDRYRRILVKFYRGFFRGADFEIEFIPLGEGIESGRIFITDIESMGAIDLYRWDGRHRYLTRETVGKNIGTIISIGKNLKDARMMAKAWRESEVMLEPRRIVGRVKRSFKNVAEEYSEPTAYLYNHFLCSGELSSLPFADGDFSIDELREIIEKFPYYSKNADGEAVERPLVEHLFDTHKTEYAEGTILNFLEAMRLEKYGEEEWR